MLIFGKRPCLAVGCGLHLHGVSQVSEPSAGPAASAKYRGGVEGGVVVHAMPRPWADATTYPCRLPQHCRELELSRPLARLGAWGGAQWTSGLATSSLQTAAVHTTFSSALFEVLCIIQNRILNTLCRLLPVHL